MLAFFLLVLESFEIILADFLDTDALFLKRLSSVVNFIFGGCEMPLTVGQAFLQSLILFTEASLVSSFLLKCMPVIR